MINKENTDQQFTLHDRHEDIFQYKIEMENELKDILNYWTKYTVDTTNGGFFGSVDNTNVPDYLAPKGIVLNARILWAFSAAYNTTKDQKYLSIAEKAFYYILIHFNDKEYGGVYWSVNEKGLVHNSKKQIYGLAFCLYGMGEYYAATKDKTAFNYAVELYGLIEKYSYDAHYKGYLEAFSRDWKPLPDLRLSDKDANAAKTMNTHLHVVEAYANLYKVWKDEKLRSRIAELLQLFDEHFIDKRSFHLKLFFDEQWNEKPDVISYGHDIEAAWLLQQCAEIINDEKWIKIFRHHAVSIANAAINGLDNDGGLWYEYEPLSKKMIKEKHSWPQAEAMIGFFNAYQLTGERTYLRLSEHSWFFIKQHILDKTNGEWFWGVYDDYSLMQKEKAGFWKCPYHNSRACMEIIKRIDQVKNIDLS